MRYDIGTELDINQLNKPVRGQVITEDVYEGVTLYSLAKDTDIPVTTYPTYHSIFLLSGKLNVFSRDRLSVKVSREMVQGQFIILPIEEPSGATVLEDAVAVDVVLGKRLETEKVKPMEPLFVRDLANYKGGAVIRTSILQSGYMIMDVITLDMHTELAKLPATGELILTVVDGEGYVRYDNHETLLHIGRSFRVSKGTTCDLFTHDTQVKMSVLLRME